MAGKAPSRRQIRKQLLRRLESRYDPRTLDYKALTRPGRGRAKLLGVGLSSAVYFVGFGAGLFGYSQGIVTDVMFAKLVWILIIPAAVVGGVSWLIADSRMEYDVRQKLKQEFARIESQGGELWRYGPVLKKLSLKKIDIDALIEQSRSGRGAEIDPQDYAEVMGQLARRLTQEGDRLIGPDEARHLAHHLEA